MLARIGADLSKHPPYWAAARADLVRNGRTTEATIYALYGLDAVAHHDVCYRFTVAGRSYDGTKSTPDARWGGWHVGDRITVRYAPHYPGTNQSADKPLPPLPTAAELAQEEHERRAPNRLLWTGCCGAVWPWCWWPSCR
jgi:hypothetical protein